MMDKLAIGQQNAVVISLDTKELIKAGVSDNTLKAYRHALKKLESWLVVEVLTIDCWRNILRSCILLGDRRRLSLKRLPRSSGAV